MFPQCYSIDVEVFRLSFNFWTLDQLVDTGGLDNAKSCVGFLTRRESVQTS